MVNVKRLFDVIGALLLGLLTSPIILCVVVAIKATSPGSVIFRQKRLGLNGAPFLINKFRKFPSDMRSQGLSVTLQFDARMTKVGRILERTKLDELPQLWNILIGEMSFVGPRPETINFGHLFIGEFEKVLSYKPGIFGPNQTKYRNESAMYPEDVDPEHFYETVLFPDKARRDLEYSERANFLTDLACIFSGVGALVFSAIIIRRSARVTLVTCIYDIATVLAGWTLAHYLKYGLELDRELDRQLFATGFVLLPIVTSIVFFVSRVYKNPVRYFAETDFYRLAGSVCMVWIIAAMLFGIFVKSTTSLVLAVSCVISVLFMAAPRLLYKYLIKNQPVRQLGKIHSRNVSIIVCGINNESVELCRLLSVGFPRANLLGLVDENRELVRREIYGFEIVGNYGDLDMIHAMHGLQCVWISSKVSDLSLQAIRAWCDANEVECVAVQEQECFKSLLEPHTISPRRQSAEDTPTVDPERNSRSAEKAATAV